MADAPSRRTFTDIMLGVSGRPLVDPSAFEEHNRLSNETIRSATMKVKGVLLFTRISCVLLPMDGSILYAFPPWDLIHRVLGTRTEGNRRRDDSGSTLLTQSVSSTHSACWRIFRFNGLQEASLLEERVNLVQGPSQSASRCVETIRRR